MLLKGVSAVSLVLLLAASSASADCVQKDRTPGAKNPAEENLDCIIDGICDDNAPDDQSNNVGNDECDCVPYYLCDNNTIIDNGKGLIDIRINDQSVCQDPLELCCSKPDVITRDAYDNNQANSAPNTFCGQRNKNGVGIQITGNVAGEAQFGEFPWMVALLGVENGVENFIGGGSLINPLVVLTAAHSVERFKTDPSNLYIRAGEWDTQSDSESIVHQQLQVKEVIMHEGYKKSVLYNDIALLVLHDEVEPKENVGTVCLPPQGAIIENSTCVATGWGKDVFGKAGCYQVFLKSILLPVVPRNQCERLLRKTRLGKRFRLHDSFMCAGGEAGKDACMGDGGGPLACPIPGDEEFYEQGGIIAWGIGCGDQDVPGVYTDVSLYRDWIDEKFAEKGFDTNSYQRPLI